MMSCSDLRRASTPFHKYEHVCCIDFRFWRGATREHPPQWGCDRGATTPEPKSDATLRAAVLFGPDVVARALQTPEGMRVARASSGPKIPRRKRGRIYEMGYLAPNTTKPCVGSEPSFTHWPAAVRS